MNNNDHPRFEQEFPEEAETLMQLCSNEELRGKVQWEQASLPKRERIYPHINDLRLGMLGWKHMNLNGTPKETPYKRSNPKINRNAPCPCGSGKKHKKCCG